MEQDRPTKALAVSKSPSCELDPLNDRVETLGLRVGHVEELGEDDAVEVVTDGQSGPLDRLELRASGPAKDATPALGQRLGVALRIWQVSRCRHCLRRVS